MYIPSDEEPAPRRASKKNTKRWCKGVVGREHVTIIVAPKYGRCGPSSRVMWGIFDDGTDKWHCSHEVVCKVCRKVLGYNKDLNFCPDYQRNQTLIRFKERFHGG